MPRVRDMSQYHTYYDRLYASKEYAWESQVVLSSIKETLGRKAGTLLDVGCGTGNHSIEFAKQGVTVVGTDIDKHCIKIAQDKGKLLEAHQRPHFFCQEVFTVKERNFDAAVCLFNVVNYISHEEYLLRFLEAINRRLRKSGVFVFDCWNGVAAMLDPPRLKKTKLISDDRVMTVVTKPVKMDLMSQTVQLVNSVRVQHPKEPPKFFTFSYTSTLWTPWHLKNALLMTGFRVRTISKWMKPHNKADFRTWKIMFVCQKIR